MIRICTDPEINAVVKAERLSIEKGISRAPRLLTRHGLLDRDASPKRPVGCLN
jgi:hypothetical protein